jgi:hypothetical protein
MRSSRLGTMASTLVALAMVTVMSAGVAMAQPINLPDEEPLTPAQEAAIRDEMSGLAAMLVNGGKPVDEAKLAANAVGICLGAAYGHGLTRPQAEAVCGEVLDAFIVEAGTIRYELTPEDRAWISGKILGWTGELAALLDPAQIAAVRSTMQACLEGHMKRGEERDDAVRHCALGLLPLLNRPELRQRLIEAAGRLP